MNKKWKMLMTMLAILITVISIGTRVIADEGHDHDDDDDEKDLNIIKKKMTMMMKTGTRHKIKSLIYNHQNIGMSGLARQGTTQTILCQLLSLLS